MRLDRPKTAVGAFAAAASERQSLMLGILGIIFGFVAYFVAKSEMVPLWAFSFTVIILVSGIYILLKALRDALQDSYIGLPAIRAVIKDPDDSIRPILLLEPSDLFGISSRVSIYHRFSDTDYELLIGYGSVLTVQGDHRIQVKVDEWVGSNPEIIAGINGQTERHLKGTIVRPSAPNAPRDEGRLGLSRLEIDRIFRLARAMQQQNVQESMSTSEGEISDERN